ncbi:TetR/AcrR family transcriptional regulator [Planococcus salinus]|uniref:TetR/AcrR family transcriptional regulator n=1 Tax=Planococcus salinus TaxID=1848460 RepID=A0A3M8P5A4_9BACL|nr:TetR/AcrR family transcriptional regulator [Planococcus salinus]RNF38847.1 TetR/AcrR family transcriptional regulator [Planococcus salinus]
MSTKKEDLLIAAERLFYRHGFHAIGLKAIVQEAGVALMTLYNHFNSKDELILSILTRREQAYFAYLEQATQESTGSVALRLASGHLRWLKDNSSNGCLFLRAKEEFTSEPDHPIVQKVTVHKENQKKFFQANGLTPTQAVQLSLLFEGSTSLAETTAMDDVENALVSMVKHV